MICVQDLNANVKDKLRLLHVNTCIQGLGLENLQKIFKGNQTSVNEFVKPAVNVAVPFFGMAVGAKTKKTQVAPATEKFWNQFQTVKVHH